MSEALTFSLKLQKTIHFNNQPLKPFAAKLANAVECCSSIYKVRYVYIRFSGAKEKLSKVRIALLSAVYSVVAFIMRTRSGVHAFSVIEGLALSPVRATQVHYQRSVKTRMVTF